MNEVSDNAINAFYRDPQQEELQVLCKCEKCRKSIFKGYEFYKLDEDLIFCEDCVRKSKTDEL